MPTITSASLLGLDCTLVQVEVDISPGLPRFTIVGLPDTAVQESRERVRAAIKNSGFPFPRTRVTVNLAPADVKKEGPSFDVPIALSILDRAGLGDAREDLLARSLFTGELALDGSIRPVTGALVMAREAKRMGFRQMFLPKENAAEAALVDGLEVFPVTNLTQLIGFLATGQGLAVWSEKTVSVEAAPSADFSAIHGQRAAKRALEVAASGGHNILMNGPPGSGKTMLAQALPSILPSLTREESIEVTCVWSVAGLLTRRVLLMSERPFRKPHHSASAVALIGGGSSPKPGEISLAHRGVLFLDEFSEFSRHVLNHLRQPIEEAKITVSRASGTVDFPARCMLVAAKNPCPCGYLTHPTRPCTCSPSEIMRYEKKISGPLLDRIDIVIEVPTVPIEELTDMKTGEASTVIRERVKAARDRQELRFRELTFTSNTEMRPEHIRRFCETTREAEKILKQAVAQFSLSARAYHRLLKVARTIADLAPSEKIETPHIAEALQYRTRGACDK